MQPTSYISWAQMWSSRKIKYPPPLPLERVREILRGGGEISKAKTFEGKYEAILALRGGMDNFLTQHNSTQHLLAPFRPHCLMPYAPLRSHMYSQEIKRVLVWWSFHDIFERLTLPQKCFRGVFAEHWIMCPNFSNRSGIYKFPWSLVPKQDNTESMSYSLLSK